MLAYHFTEMPYPYVPEEVEKAFGSARVILPNSYCDPKIMADLYERYLDDYSYADELGLDIMLNEHHQTMTCSAVNVPISAAAVIQRTKRATICILGTPLPHRDNPVRVAEEIAMLDCMSRGRIISGFVRGVPTEIQPANTNPVLTRQRFEEAHDLILKAWTTREPFNWEGRFWHHRYVNVWPRTYQQPHPPIWITGSTSDSVTWTADRQYPYACFLTPYEWTESLVKMYQERCAQKGLPEPGPDKFAYLALCYTAETDEEANDYGQGLLWYLYRERHPQLNAPPGYLPPQVLANQMLGRGSKPYRDTFEQLQQKGIVIAGSPDTMIKQITYLHERCNIGHLLMMNHAGFMSAEKTRRSMELFAREVYPAIRDLGVKAGASPTPATVAEGPGRRARMELRERAAEQLRAVVNQYAAGEAQVVRAYFEQPRTPEEHVDVLLRQSGREIQTADALHKTVKMLTELDGTVDRHAFSAELTKIAEETTHYVLLADLAEWVAGRKLTQQELHQYEVHAAPDPDVPAAKDSNSQLPEANKMIEVGRRLTGTLGYQRGRAVISLSEGGGGGAFIECARLAGDPFKDRLATAMRRILQDELRHGPDGIDAFAANWVETEAQLEDAARWLRIFMSQHLRVRNEIWRSPLSEEMLQAADRGDLPPFDPTLPPES